MELPKAADVLHAWGYSRERGRHVLSDAAMEAERTGLKYVKDLIESK